LDKNANRKLYYNVLGFSYLMEGNIQSAIEAWEHLGTEDIFEPYLIHAYQAYKNQNNLQKANQILNMAYFLGVVDEEGKQFQLKQVLKTK